MSDPCLYCGSPRSRSVNRQADVVACLVCGLYRPRLRMDRLAQQAHLDRVNANLDLAQWPRPSEALGDVAWELAFLKRQVPDVFSGAPVLDVGTAEGTFVMALARAGARAVGLEPLPRLVAHARSFDLEVHAGRFESQAIPDEVRRQRFALICFRESLYYLPDLKDAFALVHSLLAPGGYIYVKATQGQSLFFRLWPHRYLSRYNPSVSGIPTPGAVRHMLRREGFRLRVMRDYPAQTLRVLGRPMTRATQLAGRAIDPWARPLLRALSMHDRLVCVASLPSGGLC